MCSRSKRELLRHQASGASTAFLPRCPVLSQICVSAAASLDMNLAGAVRSVPSASQLDCGGILNQDHGPYVESLKDTDPAWQGYNQ